jgi:predicted dehydrogenase
MSDEPIKAGIAGAGLMGGWHAWAVKRSGGCVVAIADPDVARRQRLADRYPRAATFADCAHMLAQTQLDVLHVCTPRETHSELAAAALAAGTAVLVEKPFAPTAAATEHLFDLAAKRGVLIAPVHQFAFQDGVIRARNALARIGRIVRIAGTICSAGGKGVNGDHLDAIVADILPHPLSLMQLFLRAPLPDEGWTTLRPHSGELHASCDAAGTALSIFISMHARPTVCALEVVGTAGTLHLNLYHGYAVLESGRVSRARKITQPFELAAKTLGVASVNLARRALRSESAYPGLLRLVRAFHEAVRLRRPSPISAAATMEIARVRDRLMDDAGLVTRCQQPLASESA